MATISFGGLGNGLDFGQVVDQLVKVAHLPVDRLTAQKGDLSSKSTDYATLSTKLIALQGAADKLRLSTSFDRTTTSVSDTTAMTAIGSSTATSGTYSVRVTQLAQAHQITNKAATSVATTTTDIVGGASGTFTFRVGSGTDQTITLSDTATLEDLKSAINDLGAGATASIINTGSDTTPAYRLVLSSTSTGASNGITIVADNTTLDFTNSGGTGGVDTLQAAQDAVAIVADRGRFMQDAAPVGAGAMAAVLGLDLPALQQVCANASLPEGSVQCANLNAPGQVVISGEAGAVVEQHVDPLGGDELRARLAVHVDELREEEVDSVRLRAAPGLFLVLGLCCHVSPPPGHA